MTLEVPWKYNSQRIYVALYCRKISAEMELQPIIPTPRLIAIHRIPRFTHLVLRLRTSQKAALSKTGIHFLIAQPVRPVFGSSLEIQLRKYFYFRHLQKLFIFQMTAYEKVCTRTFSQIVPKKPKERQLHTGCLTSKLNI